MGREAGRRGATMGARGRCLSRGAPTPMPDWLVEVGSLSLVLSHWQQLGLAFLLGSFAVATWSDLKHLSAQREFLEVWLNFLDAVGLYDAGREIGRGAGR